MFKDDKMISILTAILLMVLIGTVIQRADGLAGLLGGDTAPDAPSAAEQPAAPRQLALIGEVVTVEADVLTRLDVLANDTFLRPEERRTLTVTAPPACGRVFVQDGVLQYLSAADCAAEQVIDYSVIASGTQLTASAALSINGATGAIGAGSRTETPTRTAPSAVGPVAAAPAPQPEVSAPANPAPTADAPATIAGTASEGVSDSPPEVARADGLADNLADAAAREPAAPEAAAPVEAPVPPRATAPVLAEPVAPGAPRQIAVQDAPDTALARAQIAADAAPPSPPGQTTALDTPAEPPTTPRVNPRIARISGDDPSHMGRAPGLPSVRRLAGDSGIASQGDADAFTITAMAGLPPQPRAGETGEPGAESLSDFMVVSVDVKEPVTAPPAPPRALPGAGDEAAAVAPPALSPGTQLAALAPASAPAPDARPADALATLPVDPNDPPYALQSDALLDNALAAEARSEEDGTAVLAALDPEAGTGDFDEAPALSPVPAARRETAPTAQPCDILPATTLDVRRAAQTVLSVVAPCQANTVAELAYSGLRFAVPIDPAGNGTIVTLGFEANAPALLRFSDGRTVDFDLPFKGIDRVSRVALIWDLPVTLELNALEFGAVPGSDLHVRPDNPRSFRDVRRTGGGFLTSYRAAFGVGQNAEIYSFYRKRGAPSGVVRMMIDFASRNRERLAGTCGDGDYAAPQFLVLRSESGRIERPVLRRLAPLDCSQVTEEVGDKRLISSGVSDLIISSN